MHRAVTVHIVVGLAALATQAMAAEDIAAIFDDIAHLDMRRASLTAARAVKAHPKGSPEWTTATLCLAVSLHHRQPDIKRDKEKAAALYDELIASQVPPPALPLAMIMRGRLADQIDYAGDTLDTATAVGLYERVMQDWPDTFFADVAIYHLTEVELSSMDAEATRVALDRLRAWLARRPNNPMAPVQWTLIGTSSFRPPLEDYAGAIEAFEKAIAIGLPEQIPLDAIYWRMGGIAEKSGTNDKAIQFYRKIITEVARSSFGFEAQLRIRALGGDPPELIDPFAETVEARP
ncbi:MAG: hypothetical protein HQ523_10765 [Lentisphaerae bacterium]|nr:hypothetical protein [Lentisphaerota bacterium]